LGVGFALAFVGLAAFWAGDGFFESKKGPPGISRRMKVAGTSRNRPQRQQTAGS
jgi:hypothetical protein